MARPSDFDMQIIWGAAAIGKLIGRSTRETFHLLKTGQLKGARKVGGRWCITLRALLANFEPPDPSDRSRGFVKRLTQETCDGTFGEGA